jgi:beta-glucanase (GH16 family)
MSGSLPIAVTRMTFDDEFNSFVSSANGSAGWMTTLPYGGEASYTLAGNNEAEYYGSSTSGLNPFSLNSGVLSITATAAGGSNPYGLPYNSGLITTDTSFSQTYGYFEVNAELPAGQGLWPAFWLLPASNAYTSELDVFEQLGDAPSTIYSTVHGATNGVWASDSQAFTVADTSTGFHTYGVDWEPTTTTYYIDGVAIGSAPTPASMNSPMFMLLNLAVGGAGSWPGAASASAIPAALKIDDVRVYATAATNFVGGTAAIAPGAATQTLTVVVAEDTLAGDAQFQIVVNGVAVGGVLTTQSLHALGQQDTLTFNGTWNTGSNTVSVDYLNAAAGRALYVESVTLDGVAAPTASVALTADGTTGFVVPMAATLIGSGSDTLALTVSEDAYLGNAQFTVSINGVQQGGMLTATAADATPYTPLPAQSQVFDFKGSFTGSEIVTINFLNDLYGGSAATDRNLYVQGASIDGTAISGSVLNEVSAGPQSFSFTEPVVPITPATTAGAGVATKLMLNLSEDAYLGDAQFTVAVDGVKLAAAQAVTTLHSSGGFESFGFADLLATGAHDVAVSFLNDAYGGTSSMDRNLYVNGASVNGVAVTGAASNLFSAGTNHFSISVN